ncbi:MAG: DUF2259 domain-containing protein [Spirochaetaceae bacterium]|jgi:predicted secreted protein|nr:DUF2259 domain-containing protein [Spirochaetaceae bacterium]
MMFHSKSCFYVVLGLLFITLKVGAGDIATFVDLGFSPDNKVYMFAQYGVQSKLYKAWADIFVIDVVKNNFVPGGKASLVHNEPVIAGQDGAGALYQILASNASLANRYGINYLRQGETLYIAPEETTNAPVECRDFKTGIVYKATLVESVEGTGSSLTSSFYINLEQTSANGAKKNYKVGTPQVKRSLITAYHIKRIIISPKSNALIMVITMQKKSDNDFDIRYMVEAVHL